VQPSELRHPRLRLDVAALEAHFRSERAQLRTPLRNPHHEPRVDAVQRRAAVPAAVLIPVVVRGPEMSLLLTRRHEQISYAGHICFPGGRCDDGDAGPIDTALRETHEEIGLARNSVRVLGQLGDYVSHSGFRIQPVVGLVEPPLQLVPAEGEVDEILEFPLDTVLDSASYRLRDSTWAEARAHFYIEHGGAVVAGPTVSLMIGLYEELLASGAGTPEPPA
jgi:8-oxo-dGTP pyrophosphatase MutT (NUDIX family)